MKRIFFVFAVFLAISASAAQAINSNDLLKKVKSAEAGFSDFRADLVITEGNKQNIKGMGQRYDEILRLKKAVILYKKPDKIRYDGFAEGIRATLIQNGYVKLVLAAGVKYKRNEKNNPGKRQDSLDLGFISSRIWNDNYVTVLSQDRNGIAKLKIVPKHGPRDKRHDFAWINTNNLRVLKREEYRGNGELRIRTIYSDFSVLGKIAIGTTAKLYDPVGRFLGSVSYRNLQVNVGLKDSLFEV